MENEKQAGNKRRGKKNRPFKTSGKKVERKGFSKARPQGVENRIVERYGKVEKNAFYGNQGKPIQYMLHLVKGAKKTA